MKRKVFTMSPKHIRRATKFNLLYLPLIFALISIFTISFSVNTLSKRMLTNQMEENGIGIARLVAKRIEHELEHIDEVNTLRASETEKADYQSILANVVANDSSIYYALMVNEKAIAVADTDLNDIGVDYSNDLNYQLTLKGETRIFDWYYNKINDYVLEVSVPLYYNGDIIGLVGVGMSKDNTNQNSLYLTYGSLIMALVVSIILVAMHRRMTAKPIMNLNEHIDELFISLDDSAQVIESLNREIESLAFMDFLTKLPNRFSFRQKFDDMYHEASSMAIVMLDLDNFKEFNDEKGHLFGDRLLMELADRLRLLNHEGMFVSRFGGDEFLILIPYVDRDDLDTSIHRISLFFDEPFTVDDYHIVLESSMGVSLMPRDGVTLEVLTSKADLAMYDAKAKGKNQMVIYDESLMSHIKRKNYLTDLLKKAIKNKGFTLVYQPQVDVKTGNIMGFEALIRLKDHPISPAEFIEVAEEKGLIIDIGRFVIQDAIMMLVDRREKGLSLKPVAINFSGRQFSDDGLADYVTHLVNKNNLDPILIEFELTENTLVENDDRAMVVLNQLKSRGHTIALDDFGTGYSSLSYLDLFPIDKVKFDKKFIDRYLNAKGLQIIEKLIELANAYDIDVVIEGVETLDQVKLCKKLDCQLIQGYYFSKPVDLPTLAELYDRVYDV